MADKLQVCTSDTLLVSGSGALAAIVATVQSGASNPKLTFYNNTTGSGTAIFQAVLVSYPLLIFFPDRFAPRFSTGLYVKVETGIVLTVWWRQL